MQEECKAAAITGNTETIEALLAAGVDPNERDAHGRSLLHFACENAHTETVRALLRDKRTDVYAVDAFGVTGLHFLVKK